MTTPGHSSLSLAGDGVPGGTQILIDLATPATPQATWAPWACQGVLPPDFVIGQATCVRDAAKTAPVTAAMAQQVCTGNPDFGAPVGPTAEPEVPGCERLTLSFYGFSPTLQVRLVAPITGR